MLSKVQTRVTAVAFCAGLIGVTAFFLYGKIGHGRSGSVEVRNVHGEGGNASVLLDARRQQLVGVKTVTVVQGALRSVARATGMVTWDQTRLVESSLKFDGWVREVFVSQTGQRVERNQALFSVYSQDLVSAQVQLLAALRNREQLPPAQQADRDFAERLIDTPRQRLINLDVPEDQIRLLEQRRQVSESVVFRSPVAGVVVVKNVLKGQYLKTGDTLYRIADASVLWVEADFRVEELGLLPIGATVAVWGIDAPERRWSGRVLSQAGDLSGPARTIKVRIEVANPNGRLKPGMFTTVEVMEPTSGLLIPVDAVVDSGRRQTVFVANGNGHFEPRKVVVGARADDRVVIVSGLKEGEEVVRRATFLLDSESQLRSTLESYAGAPSEPGVVRSDQQVTLRFGTDSDSPAAGDVDVHVELSDRSGLPVTDATVDVQFYMAPMPTMNMPAMRSNAHLAHAGRGVYRGRGTLSMAGRWDASISVYRSGVRLASQHASLVAH